MASPDADLEYARLQRFYATQMQLLDAGHTDEWAATFTEDATFTAGSAAPVKTREAIAAGAAAVAAKFAADGVTRRHWIGMLTADTQDDTLVTKCYALVLEIPDGGPVIVSRSTVCHDLLARAGDSWLVRQRTVTRDDLGAQEATD